jgi:pilus assembly protein CpaE
MPFDTAAHDTSQIAAYVCTDAGAGVTRAVLDACGQNGSSLHGGGLSGAARVCGDMPPADLVLAEIGNIPVDMACECVAEICRTGADVIVLGLQTDITTYRALLGAGALEYFSMPASADEILAVRRKPAAPAQSAAPATGISIAVVGSNGGVGASVLAQNLAFVAARTKKGAGLRTALIDADLEFGTQAIDLDRDETLGLFEALRAPDRIDATFIGATMEQLRDNLSMYSHQLRQNQDPIQCETALPRLYGPLRSEFEAVVTDLPRATLMRNPALGAHFDALLLLVPSGFAGVNAAIRLIERLKADCPDLRILPVLSELRSDAKLSHKDIAKAIGSALVATLPRSDAAIGRAHRAARPVVECDPRSAYAKAVAALWVVATTQPAEGTKRSRKPLIKRIFG